MFIMKIRNGTSSGKGNGRGSGSDRRHWSDAFFARRLRDM